MVQINKQAIDAKIKAAMSMEHPWHNRFHLEMPFGLINDPNGLACAHGIYHIFFQWNPYGCVHQNKCWAHVHTEDFIHYSLPSLALWPSDAQDKDGCYSGSAYVEGQQLHLVYTGNAKDEAGRRSSCQREAIEGKDGSFHKERVLISGPPEGYTEHFRDPYVFLYRNRRLMVLGAQSREERGCVLLYEEGCTGWRLLGELQTQLGCFGYMWECPNLLTFPEGEVLLFSPQGLSAEKCAFQNLYQSGYVSGHLMLEQRQFVHGAFEELDYGFDFYAPQVLQQGERHILFAWMGMPECEAEYPTRQEGWLYSMTMPRELIWKQGKLYSHPVQEMKELRELGSARQLQCKNTAELKLDLPQQAELSLRIDAGQAKFLWMELLWGEEKVRFTYERQTQMLSIDRSGMSLGGRGIRHLLLPMEDSLSLTLYVDRTAIESFWQDGARAASFMVFPRVQEKLQWKLSADAPMAGIMVSCWSLAGISYPVMGKKE